MYHQHLRKRNSFSIVTARPRLQGLLGFSGHALVWGAREGWQSTGELPACPPSAPWTLDPGVAARRGQTRLTPPASRTLLLFSFSSTEDLGEGLSVANVRNSWYLSMKKATDLLETYWDLSLSPRRG